MEETKDYRKAFSTSMTKSSLYAIADVVHSHPEDFDKIYRLITSPRKEISGRAAWACQKIIEQDPSFFNGKQDELISFAMQTPYSGTRRSLLSILLSHMNFDPIPVVFLDFCFNHMLDINEAIAVQALCVKLAYKLCLSEPELLSELDLYLAHANLDYYGPAVKSCVRNIRKKIN